MMALEVVELFSEMMEIMMIVSFGLSWPMNVIKSYRARTAKGKALSNMPALSSITICMGGATPAVCR